MPVERFPELFLLRPKVLATVLRDLQSHGLPQSIYSDRHSVFWTDREPTLEEQLINKALVPRSAEPWTSSESP
jgi:hypothetical protein